MATEKYSPAAPTGAGPLEEEAPKCEWHIEGDYIVCGDKRINIDALAKEVEKAVAQQIVDDKIVLTTLYDVKK